MSVNTNIIISTNLFQGFQNYNSTTFSVVYAGGSIGVGTVAGPISASVVLNNSNAVSLLGVAFTGLDGFTRQLPGIIVVDYPNAGAPQYQIEVISYYSSGNLTCDVYISNQTGGAVVVPAITFNYSAKLYQAPF